MRRRPATKKDLRFCSSTFAALAGETGDSQFRDAIVSAATGTGTVDDFWTNFRMEVLVPRWRVRRTLLHLPPSRAFDSSHLNCMQLSGERKI